MSRYIVVIFLNQNFLNHWSELLLTQHNYFTSVVLRIYISRHVIVELEGVFLWVYY